MGHIITVLPRIATRCIDELLGASPHRIERFQPNALDHTKKLFIQVFEIAYIRCFERRFGPVNILTPEKSIVKPKKPRTPARVRGRGPFLARKGLPEPLVF